MTRQPITIVQGGQYGSEAKGAITGYLCQTEGADICVRTGAVNAGHTVMYDGKAVKMQQLPVGWVNPNTFMVIGAGAMVHPEILDRECALVTQLTGRNAKMRLIIDPNAGVHTESHTKRSAASGRHYSMGATGKGCSEAIIDKISGRGKGYQTFGRSEYCGGYQLNDTATYLNRRYNMGDKIVIEATQGTLLDLHTGPYPYTTHKSVLPGAWLAECGLSPALALDIVMVVRTFPIRVAGNSGPMPLETDWLTLAREMNEKRALAGMAPLVAESALAAFESALHMIYDDEEWQKQPSNYKLSELNRHALLELSTADYDEVCKVFELTTVTRKMRRIARLDPTELKRAAMLVRPHRVALTFMNYVFPEHWFATSDFIPPPAITNYVRGVESIVGAPVVFTSYGPGPEHIVRL